MCCAPAHVILPVSMPLLGNGTLHAGYDHADALLGLAVYAGASYEAEAQAGGLEAADDMAVIETLFNHYKRPGARSLGKAECLAFFRDVGIQDEDTHDSRFCEVERETHVHVHTPPAATNSHHANSWWESPRIRIQCTSAKHMDWGGTLPKRVPGVLASSTQKRTQVNMYMSTNSRVLK